MADVFGLNWEVKAGQFPRPKGRRAPRRLPTEGSSLSGVVAGTRRGGRRTCSIRRQVVKVDKF